MIHRKLISPFHRAIVRWKKNMLSLHGIWVLAFSLLLTLPASAASEQKVILNIKSETLSNVLLEISKQTGAKILYREDVLNNVLCKNLIVEAKDVNTALDIVLKNTGFHYTVLDGVYVVKQQTKDPEVKNFQLSGKVTDENKQPLPGVTILVKQGEMVFGASTGVDGTYKVTLPTAMKEFTITYSFIGMETTIVTYKGKNVINIVLKEQVAEMDEVVITGYQSMKKHTVAGSVSTVRAEDLILDGTQSLESALQGKIPGMIVMNTSGLTGTRQRVRVRGTSTILGNAEPVWVVDGVIQEDPLPFSNNDFNTQNLDDTEMINEFVGGAISWLNPNDIESVSVLKDASATAIYGVKAANGVIVINTKKGKAGRMSVSYNANFTFEPRLNFNRMELMNSQQRVDVSREAYERGLILGQDEQIGYSALMQAYRKREISLDEFTQGAKKLETANSDWFKLLFRNAFSHNHTFSISGGDQKTTYRASFGVSSNNNSAIGNDQTRYTGNVSLNTRMWEDKIRVDVNMAGSLSKTSAFAGGSPFDYATSTNRAIECIDENGELAYYKHSNGFSFNMLNELENTGNDNTMSTLNTTLNLYWNILQGLSFNTQLSYNLSNTDGCTWYDEKTNAIAQKRGYDFEEYGSGDAAYEKSGLPHGGEYNESTSNTMTWGWRNQLEFNKMFKEKHAVSAMLGYEVRSSQNESYQMKSYGYLPHHGKLFLKLPLTEGGALTTNKLLGANQPRLQDSKTNTASYYLSTSYCYDGRYALNASVRSDASNRFGQDKDARFLPVWSLGLRWNIAREKWFSEQNLLNDLNLRVSYGYQGNTVMGVSPDLIATISTGEAGSDYSLKIRDLPNPHLRWEKVQNFNVGLDYSLFRSRFNGGFEFYAKKTKDMVTEQVVPFANGVESRKINGGTMSNWGWDANFSITPIKTKDWRLNLNFNLGKVYNEVQSTLQPTGTWQEAVSGNLNKDGYTISSFWAFRFVGLNPVHGGPEFDMTGVEREEAVDDATLYMEYAGKLEPDFTTNLSMNLSYKNLSLSASFYLSLGNQQFLSALETNSIPSEYENMSTEWSNRWRKPGDELHTNTPSLPDVATSNKTIQYTRYSNRRDENSGNKYVSPWKDIKFSPYELYANSNVRVVDAWYVRCNNLSMRYNVPVKKLPKYLTNLSVNCSVANPFQLRSKDFKGRDPEVALGEQPLSSKVTFGLSVSF